jgi:hypothetical protein
MHRDLGGFDRRQSGAICEIRLLSGLIPEGEMKG